MKCPNCGLINPEDALRCDCGYDFKTGHTRIPTNDFSNQDGFFSFHKMISPSLIKILYIVGMFACTIGGIGLIIKDVSKGRSGQDIFVGLAVLVLGNLIWRIGCEGWILIFSIHSELVSIRKKLS